MTLVDWIPSFTGLTLGNGAVAAIYYYDGSQVNVEISLTFGTTTTMTFNPTVSLPVPSVVPLGSELPIGSGTAHIGTSSYPVFVVTNYASQTTVLPYLLDNPPSTQLSAGWRIMSASQPAAWGVGSTLAIKFSYRPASTALPVTCGAAGDSMTAWLTSQVAYNPATSWVNFITAPGTAFTGTGFARGSATTTYLLTIARQIHAHYTVMLAGVNDIYFGISPATTLLNLVALAEIVKTPIILSALAPYDTDPEAALTLNSEYASLAVDKGWLFVDPWDSQRASDGKWITGASADGVHPGLAAQQAAAAVIRAALTA